MKRSAFLILFLVASASLVGERRLEKAWESAPELKTPESVLFNPGDSLLYVSSINGSPSAKDSNGFISRVALDGAIRKLEWATGLNAPKGSAMARGKLYVADIDQLVEIDLHSGTISKRYPAAGAKFLNDVAVAEDGTIYISDSSPQNSAIYALAKGQLEVWSRDEEISAPNGLSLQGQELFFGNTGDGTLKAVDLPSKRIRTVARVGFGIDGLKADGQGGWFVSDWAGRTSHIDKNGKATTLLDTTPSQVNSADIEFIPSQNLLIIPTFFDNRVVAYMVKS